MIEQKRIARATSPNSEKAHVFARPIVTRLEKLSGFYPAEDYHQDFAVLHPTYPYIVFNDAPKVENLQAAVRGFLPRHAGHGDGFEQGESLVPTQPLRFDV